MKILDSSQSLKSKSPNSPESFRIPEYDLEEGIEKISEITQRKLLTQSEPIVIEIAGGSSSGKTSTVASRIKETFGDEAFIFSMDDYCYERDFRNTKAKKRETINDEQPEALDLDLFKSHLVKLKHGEEIQKPIFDLKRGKQAGFETVQPHKVIIIEGLFALNDLIVKEGDVRVFVDTSTHGRLLRRLFRDTKRTGKEPAETLKYFLETIVQMHEKYVQSTKDNADLVIKNEYDPKVEAQKTNLYEIQQKFKGETEPESLQQIGAKKITSINQEDRYYGTNSDGSSVETGEILRIRYENGHKILTYKGPRIESDLQIRPQFEFEIDNEIEEKFLSVYKNPVKVIKKKCVLYQLDNVVLSVDNVSKIEDGKETEVGKFLEIRSTKKDINTKEIEGITHKLGLSIKDSLEKSYFEM